MARLTELEAVNQCLAAIGESPINELEDTQSADAAIALNKLRYVAREVQTKGWEFNREYAYRINPNGDSQIALPANCIRAATPYAAYLGRQARVAERDGLLYNITEQTFVWEEAVELDLLVMLDWDELPEPARLYITAIAVKEFQAEQQGNGVVSQTLAEKEFKALVILEQAEDDMARANAIYNNTAVVNALHGQGVRRKRP